MERNPFSKNQTLRSHGVYVGNPTVPAKGLLGWGLERFG